MAFVTRYSSKCGCIPESASRRGSGRKAFDDGGSVRVPCAIYKKWQAVEGKEWPFCIPSGPMSKSAKWGSICNAGAALSALPSDEGCWWLMAGFLQPDYVSPPIMPKALAVPSGNEATSSSDSAAVTTNDVVPVAVSLDSNLKSISETSLLPSTSDPTMRIEGLNVDLKLGVEEKCVAPLNATESNSSDSDSESDEKNKDSFSNGSFQENSQVTLPKPLSVGNLHHSMFEGPRLRVAYQGVPGAYSEAAACKAYPSCEPVPCEQFDAAFQAVELWLVDRAVLPIENSLGGSIHRNYDLLLRHKLHIVGEVQLPVHHCLMALPDSNLEQIKRVLSHPQALAQCEMSLQKLGVKREAVADTAGAAQTISNEKLTDAAAVASSRAAKIYGLKILAEGIQDDSDNITRFLILAREPIIPKTDRPFKTSIVFSLEQGSGVLFKALSVFALRNINLTKIESRPRLNLPVWLQGTETRIDTKNENSYHMFDYLFYIDFEASMAEARAQNALRHLQEFATFLRVLGSYPIDVNV